MRLLALTLAAAAAVAFAALQNPSAVAQSSDTQAGGKSQSTQGNAAGQQRGSKDSATRQSGSGGQSAGRSEKSQQSAQGKSERSQTTVGIGSGSNRAMVRSRVQTRLSVRERGASDVTIKGKRSRHIVALHDQPSAMVIKKKKKFVRYGARTRFVASEPEERALIIKKNRHPSIAIRGESSRTTFRTHVGGSNINARASVRTRATTSGSATTTKKESTGSSTTMNRTMNRGQRSAPSATTGSGNSQSRGQGQSGNKDQSGNTGGSSQQKNP